MNFDIEKIKRLSILFVEDDEDIVVAMVSIFKSLCSNFDVAENGQVGLKLAEQNIYDVIVSDINMPVMDGIEMAKSIRNSGIDIPIIFTTAHTEDRFQNEASNMSNIYYIIKPYAAPTLLEVIDKAL